MTGDELIKALYQLPGDERMCELVFLIEGYSPRYITQVTFHSEDDYTYGPVLALFAD